MTTGITLITPTGGRPESFAQCASYVQRFHRPEGVPIQWLVVNDGPSNWKALYIDGIQSVFVTPKHVWTPGSNTLGKNLLEAIPHIEHDCILFVEDDDWYAPGYLKSMYEALQSHDLVGEFPARYYHVPTRQYSAQGNRQHASLCQTGIRRSMLSLLEDICRTQTSEFIDVRLWRSQFFQFTSKSKLLETKYCVGMKGLPGRAGIGIGHRPERNPRMWVNDQNLSVLTSWIGSDCQLYGLMPNLDALQPQGAIVGH